MYVLGCASKELPQIWNSAAPHVGLDPSQSGWLLLPCLQNSIYAALLHHPSGRFHVLTLRRLGPSSQPRLSGGKAVIALTAFRSLRSLAVLALWHSLYSTPLRTSALASPVFSRLRRGVS